MTKDYVDYWNCFLLSILMFAQTYDTSSLHYYFQDYHLLDKKKEEEADKCLLCFEQTNYCLQHRVLDSIGEKSLLRLPAIQIPTRDHPQNNNLMRVESRMSFARSFILNYFIPVCVQLDPVMRKYLVKYLGFFQFLSLTSS